MKYEAAMLYSGGLDSGAVFHDLITNKYESMALIMFNYGQKAFKAEKAAMESLIQHYQAEQKYMYLNIFIIDVSKMYGYLHAFGTLPTPLSGRFDAGTSIIPWRNFSFLMQAIGYCEMHGIEKLHYGCGFNYEGPAWDSNPTALGLFEYFISRINEAIEKEQEHHDVPVTSRRTAVKVSSPVMLRDRADYIHEQIKTGLPVHLTYSCYLGSRVNIIDAKSGRKLSIFVHCNECNSCKSRLNVLNQIKKRYPDTEFKHEEE